MYQFTINDEMQLTDNIGYMAMKLNESWPAVSITQWIKQIQECEKRGWKLVNTGTDGNRITVKALK